MNRSLNEIDAHAKRAARGAGLSWGLAEEAGWATRWLASHGLEGPALLCEVLSRNDGRPYVQVAPVSLDGEWRAPVGDLCPLAAGAALNDCADRLAGGQAIDMINVSCPLLVVPFAAWAAIHLRMPVQVRWRTLALDTDGSRLRITDPDAEIHAAQAATLTCRMRGDITGTTRAPGLRGDVPPGVWAKLDRFAQRTFAPATEASRLLGAGTGGSDND